MFSYHGNNRDIGIGSHYADRWRQTHAPSAGEVSDLALKYAVSPCIWHRGARKKDNFWRATWLGLDFDEGMSIHQAKKVFADYIHVIGTTKSHRIYKGGVIADRFRVFLRLKDRCDSYEDYEETVRPLVKEHGADKQCIDAARFFWPCKIIISQKHYGRLISVVDSRVIVEDRKKYFAAKQKTWMKPKDGSTVPNHILKMLECGVAQGSRNTACFQVAADLGFLGFSFDEIVCKIMASNIPVSSDVESEVRGAVRRGMAKGASKSHI